MQEFLGIYMLNLKVGMIKQIRGTNMTAPENSIHAKAGNDSLGESGPTGFERTRNPLLFGPAMTSPQIHFVYETYQAHYVYQDRNEGVSVSKLFLSN